MVKCRECKGHCFNNDELARTLRELEETSVRCETAENTHQSRNIDAPRKQRDTPKTIKCYN